MTSNHDDELPWPEDAIEVARIGEAWGIKGWFRVEPHAGDPKAVFSSKRWFIQPPAGRPRPAGAPALPKLLRIVQAKEHGDGVVASAHDVGDRGAAEALRGARIFISRASFPTPGNDEFYWVDLIGLNVVNREGLQLGVVTDLLDTGAGSVLRVVEPASETPPESAPPADTATPPANGARRRKPAAPPPTVERLIPFVAAYVDEVRLADRLIRVDWQPDY